MRLSFLFEACLQGPYIHTKESGDFRLVREGGRLFLFFPHSDGKEDWQNNLDFPAVAFGEGGERLFAHRGFVRVWEALAPHVLPSVLDVRTKDVTVVGYSHGGALAVLCYEAILRARPSFAHRLTGVGFGAPRVLWGARRRRINERFRHFTVVRNAGDAVTHLPPALLGYYHAGKLLTVGEAGKYSAIDAHRPENILAELKKYEE